MRGNYHEMASPYHGSHEYSTFSSSTISKQILHDGEEGEEEENANKFYRCFCFLCRLSSSLILHPLGPFRCIWDMFVMLLLIYTSFEIPYTMAFEQTGTIKYIGLFVDCSLLIDIFLNFRTAYFDKFDNLLLVTNKKSICKKYFRTWFFIDFLTCIPFEFLISADDNVEAEGAAFEYIKILRICRLFRIVKILRLIKMLRIFDAFMKQFITRELIVFMKIFKIIFGMIMFAHFAACFWWYVGSKTSPSWIDKHSLRDSDEATFAKYSYAWYWAVVTLFTTGYGDIVATNTIEQWVSSIFILIGTCFFAYFVGTLTALITEGDKINAYELEKLEEAQSFCEKKKLPKELTRAILTHIRYHCNYNYVFDETEMLTLLPSYLQHDIHTYVAKQFLLKLNMFQNEFIHLPEFIIGAIAVKIKSISCNQTYKLYDINDRAKEFYIQRTGKSVMYDRNNKIMHHLSRGSVCGEYSSFLFKKRKRKIECATWSEFYAINIDDIKEILELYYPKTSNSKWRQIQKYIKYAYKHNLKHTVKLYNFSTTDHLENDRFTATVPKLINQRSIFCEESVHIFDNTRKTQKPLPTLDNNLSSIRVPTDDNNDIDIDMSDNCPSPISPAPTMDTIDPNDNNNDNNYNIDGVNNDGANNDGVNHRTLHKKKISRISSTFKIKSDSNIRNDMVVAHAVKHQRLAKSKKKAKVPSVSSSMEAATEMMELHNNNHNNYDDHDGMRMIEDLNDSYDSECSFSSISSDTNSRSSDYNDGIHERALSNSKVNKTNYLRKKKINKTRKKRRTGGKFGAKGGGHHSGNVKQRKIIHHNNNQNKHRHHKKRNESGYEEQQQLRLNKTPSIDEEALLEPLKIKENVNNNINNNNNNDSVTYSMYNDNQILDSLSIVHQSSQ